MLLTSIECANDFFKSNPDFLKPESVDECKLAKSVGDFLYISCYIKTKTLHNFHVIYDAGLCGNLVKTKEKAFAEDDYWSAFNKGGQFEKNITDEGLGNALVVLNKKNLSIFNIYFFKDTYNADFPVSINDVVDNKVIVNFVEYDYVFEDGVFKFLSFVDTRFLKLGDLWIGYPGYFYDAKCNWNFINFRNNSAAEIHALELEDDKEINYKYTKCYYNFESCLFYFSNESDSMTMDYQTLTHLTENDRLYLEQDNNNWKLEIAQCKEDEEKRKSEDRKRSLWLLSAVSSWDSLNNDFYFTYLFDYYPTSCEFEAKEEEWKHRRLIWNFKNDIEKDIEISKHKAAIDEVVPLIKQKLFETFGKDYLQYITLVCVPASTSSKNYSRYSVFSKRLCEETYMKNGYNYMYVMKDGMSKKHPDNKTGRSIQPVIEYDKEYFSGKCVLLFDDVVTKGTTMLKYKEEFEKMGAIVIGGFCLGKTKHKRPLEESNSRISTYPNFPPLIKEDSASSADDLPF